MGGRGDPRGLRRPAVGGVLGSVSVLGDRLAAIDYIKAAAIVAVVATHAGPNPWLPDAGAFDRTVRGSLAVFHVPSFLLIAGFLYGAQPVLSTADLGRRLQRILVPYLVASLIVIALGSAKPATLGDAVFMLATGSALGTYYFVFVLALSVTLTYVLTLLSPRLPRYALSATFIWWLFRPLIVAPSPPSTLPGFWFFRNPVWFGAYFLVGWNLRGQWDGVRRFLVTYRAPLTILATTACVIHLALWPRGRATYVDPFARMAYVLSVVCLIASATQRARIPTPVRFLSDDLPLPHALHRGVVTARVGPWRTGAHGVADQRGITRGRRRRVFGASSTGGLVSSVGGHLSGLREGSECQAYRAQRRRCSLTNSSRRTASRSRPDAAKSTARGSNSGSYLTCSLKFRSRW